jgi:hypothetical protein
LPATLSYTWEQAAEMAKSSQVMAFNLAEMVREFLIKHLPEKPSASLWERMRQREQVCSARRPPRP